MAELLTRVLNFWSGPGAGKSTTKAGTFFEMKCAGFKAVQIEEYATEKSVERDWATLHNQRKVLLRQERRQRRYLGHVEWIVTDSPLVLSCLYGTDEYSTKEFHQEVWDLYNKYENVNIWIDRVKPYELYARHHSEEEARELDLRLLDLIGEQIHFRTPGDRDAPSRVLDFLKNYTGVAKSG